MSAAKRRPGSRRSGRYYCLDDLLARQPKALKKDPQYRDLLSHFLTSDALQRLRIGGRCFRLLDRGAIAPEHLPSFYRTYRLPRDPFFPLFFRIKRSYLQERQALREARIRYIRDHLEALPGDTLRFIRFLAEWERTMHPRGDSPYWEKHLCPTTKKRIREYEAFGPREWQEFFQAYLTGLGEHYRRGTPLLTEKLAACSVLGLTPGATPLTLPGKEEVRKAYRSLSLEHHPDRGGDPGVFVSLQKAKEVLCASS